MSLRGFAHPWFFLFLLTVLALIVFYVVAQLAAGSASCALANMELLESVAPLNDPTGGDTTARHPLIASLTMFTIAMAGLTNDLSHPAQPARS